MEKMREKDDYSHVSTYILNSCKRNEYIDSFHEYFSNIKFGKLSDDFLYNQTFHHPITIDVKKSEKTISEFNYLIKSEFSYAIRTLYFNLIENKLKNFDKSNIIDISPRKLKIKNLINQTKETVETTLNTEILEFLNKDNIEGFFFGKKSQLSKSLDINHWEHKEENNNLYNYLGSKNKVNFFRIEHDVPYEILILANDNFIDFYIDPLESWEFENFFRHNPYSPIIGGIQEEYFRFKMDLVIHFRDTLEIFKVIKYSNNEEIKDDKKYK